MRFFAAIRLPVAPLDQPAFWRAGPVRTTPARTNSPQIARVVSEDEVPANSALYAIRCQLPQRLLKTFNRDDRQALRIGPCVPRVLAGRDEEQIHIRAACSDGLLLHAADRDHRAVEGERARRRDPTTMGDVAAELSCDLEREGEARRRAAHPPEVDVHVDRQLDLRVLVD